MIPLTLKEIAEACGGRLAGADADALVRSVVTDSRRAMQGSLFVALPGEHVHGARFVGDAIAAGAVGAIVAEDAAAEGPLVLVRDAQDALRALAEHARDRLGARVIAITGSSGKTLTKDLTAAAVGAAHRVVASEASYNNEIGVPLTILAADERTDVLVVEVGSRGLGHIASLMPAVRPDVGVVTNIGPAHLGMFGSLEVTARAKAELVEALQPEGVAVLNADDPATPAVAERVRARIVRVGSATDADVRALEVGFDEALRARFTVQAGDERAPVRLGVPGEHMVANALAALAAATVVGVPLAAAAEAIAGASVSGWRMEIRDIGRLRVLNDAYNANPDSTAAALKTLVAMAKGRPTWAVLGPMAELGAASAGEHDRIGRLAVRLGVRHLVTVGEEARALHEAARLEGMPPAEATFVPDAGEAAALVAARAEDGALVLVKASRAAHLERVVEALEASA